MQTTLRAEIRLANDIAAQFHHVPTEQAADAIAGHIRGFWEPRMRAQLVARVAEGADGLDPLVVAAVGLIV